MIAIAILIAQLIALGLLARFMVRHKTPRSSFLFTSYVGYSMALDALQLACINNRLLYFWVFWIGEAGTILFTLAALCESFIATFRGYFLLAWFRWILPLISVAVIAYATWKALAQPPVMSSRFAAVIIGTEVAAQYLVLATFICYAVLVKILKVNFGFYYGIVAGFAIASIGMLGATLLRSEFGTRFVGFITWIPSVAYCCALLIWIACALKPLTSEHQVANEKMKAASALAELHEYGSILKKVGK